MRKIFAFALFALLASSVQAQKERSPFRKGYIRLGLNNLGSAIDENATVKSNFLDGQYGSGLGYTFETGTIFYFNKPKSGKKIGYGLDWTIVSLNYNPLSKWKDYAAQKGSPDAVSAFPPLVASIATKLGPVVSFNPVEKLIIDARVQLVAGINAFVFDYYDEPTHYNYTMIGTNELNEANEVEDNLFKLAVFGVKPNFGISVRRKAIGLAVDYAPGSLNMNYREQLTGDVDEQLGKAKFKTNNLQLKLSFTF